MSALGVMLVGFGLLTVWSGLDRTNVFDVLRSFIGVPVVQRDDKGKPTGYPGVKGASA